MREAEAKRKVRGYRVSCRWRGGVIIVLLFVIVIVDVDVFQVLHKKSQGFD